jgi:hypothetical protein
MFPAPSNIRLHHKPSIQASRCIQEQGKLAAHTPAAPEVRRGPKCQSRFAPGTPLASPEAQQQSAEILATLEFASFTSILILVVAQHAAPFRENVFRASLLPVRVSAELQNRLSFGYPYKPRNTRKVAQRCCGFVFTRCIRDLPLWSGGNSRSCRALAHDRRRLILG